MKNNNDFNMNVYRGGIYLVDLGKRIGSEQGGIRPVVVMQNDMEINKRDVHISI